MGKEVADRSLPKVLSRYLTGGSEENDKDNSTRIACFRVEI
jgi:hypothetical protein